MICRDRQADPIAILAVCYVLISAAGTNADQVIIQDANYTGAKVTRFAAGRLQFRSSAGKVREAWIEDVDLIQIDRRGAFADLNEGERYMTEGDPRKAIARYRRALRLAEDFWVDLISARMVMACDRAERVEQASMSLVRLLEGKHAGAACAARLIPRHLPKRQTSDMTRALAHIDSSIDRLPRDTHRAVLRLFRFEIVRHMGGRQLPKVAESVATMPLPEQIRCDRAYAIIHAALAETLKAGVTPERLAALDQAIADCPFASLADLLMLKGDTLLSTAHSREENIRAGWAYMRVVVHMPDSPHVPRALLGTADVLERIQQGNQAAAMLRECLAHDAIEPSLKKRAQQRLRRLAGGHNQETDS